MSELRLPELPPRYNAGKMFIDARRGVREDRVAIRCQGKSVTYKLRESDVATGS